MMLGRRPAPLAAFALLLCSLSLPARADDPFTIERAAFELDESLLLLNMEVSSEIPDYIAIAIEQGFSVPMMFEFEIRATRNWWIDDRVISLKQQYLLHHQPMLDSYVVFDVNNAERRYFDRREMAVKFIQVVYNYPMLDINNLAPDREYYARVRFGIDTDELPLPLKSSSLWDNDWDLKSDWFEWEVPIPRP